jgi:hypothetical protein
MDFVKGSGKGKERGYCTGFPGDFNALQLSASRAHEEGFPFIIIIIILPSRLLGRCSTSCATPQLSLLLFLRQSESIFRVWAHLCAEKGVC